MAMATVGKKNMGNFHFW